MEFTDLSQEDAFYTYVQCLACRGVVSSYSDGSFRSGADITRGLIAKIVSSAAGFNEDPGEQIYADVHPTGEGSQFYEWIMSLTNRRVMRGYPCATADSRSGPCDGGDRPYFCPANTVTRGQAAKIVANTFLPNCQTQAPAKPRCFSNTHTPAREVKSE